MNRAYKASKKQLEFVLLCLRIENTLSHQLIMNISEQLRSQCDISSLWISIFACFHSSNVHASQRLYCKINQFIHTIALFALLNRHTMRSVYVQALPQWIQLNTLSGIVNRVNSTKKKRMAKRQTQATDE